MKRYGNLNKLGGTELRTKDQLSTYISALFFIRHTNVDSLKDYGNKWKTWCGEGNINRGTVSYKYKNDKIDRFKQTIVNNMIKKWRILQEKDGKYVMENTYEKMFLKKNYKNLFFRAMQENYSPFRETVKYILEKHRKSTKINPVFLFRAFQSYGEEDNFSELYNLASKDKLFDYLAKKDYEFEKTLYFRKWPKYISFYKNVIKILNNKEKIRIEDIGGYDFKNDNYLKKVLGEDITTTYQFITRINKLNVEQFSIALCKSKYVRLETDYKDLFFRWLYNFGFLKSRSTKNKTISQKYNFVKQNNYYLIDKRNYLLKYYPFAFEDVKNYLNKINSKNFNFKLKIPEIAAVNNSTIAEYFVNLYFGYKFDIVPKLFSKYCNTQMDIDLYPVFTAPAKKADMTYYDEKRKKIINIETTIHKDKSSIFNNEVFPCRNHLNASIKQKVVKNVVFYFVSHLGREHYQSFETEFRNTIDKDLKISFNFRTFKPFEEEKTLEI